MIVKLAYLAVLNSKNVFELFASRMLRQIKPQICRVFRRYGEDFQRCRLSVHIDRLGKAA